MECLYFNGKKINIKFGSCSLFGHVLYDVKCLSYIHIFIKKLNSNFSSYFNLRCSSSVRIFIFFKKNLILDHVFNVKCLYFC